MQIPRSLLLALLPVLPAQFFQSAPGTVPSSDPQQLMYDSRRDRTVALTDTATWEHDGVYWRRITTPQLPRARYEYGMAFDGRRVLVHGGGTPIGQTPPALDDFWAYDGSNWSALSTANGPGRRRGHAMAYDPNRQRLVLFGGTDMNNGFPGDTWEWNGATWSQVSTFGPGSRVWHRMVYDPGRQKVLLVGGANNPWIYDDTWEWDGTSWMQTVTGNQFPARIMPGLVFDTVLRRTLMIGGFDGLNSAALNDVHAYDPVTATWSLIAVPNAPLLEQVMAAAFDPSRGRTLILTWDVFTSSRPFFYRSTPAAPSYQAYGQGCPGGLGQVPVLAAATGSTPARGVNFVAEVSQVGNASMVVLGTGFSSVVWQGTTLPWSLAAVGMPGCSAHASLDLLLALPVDSRTRKAQLTWAIPNNPWFAGLVFFQQAITLDPSAANGVGGVSNGSRGITQ